MPTVLMQTAVALLTYAYGANWNAARAQRDMLIFEYYDAWSHGDAYVYLESQNLGTHRSGASADSGATTAYGEVHGRLGGAVSAGPVRALYAAEQVDLSQGDIVLLTGTGIGWGGATRTLFQTDVFVRYDPADRRPTWQAVAYGEWGLHIGPVPLRYGGYVKVIGPEGSDPTLLVSDTRLVWTPTPHVRIGAAFRVQRDQAVPEAVIQWRF